MKIQKANFKTVFLFRKISNFSKLKTLGYQIIEKCNITSDIAEVFIEHLKEQKKVTIPSIEKLKMSCTIVFCYADETLIGIGALKLNESLGFEKAGLNAIEGVFALELGYFYVNESFRNLGISTTIARLLLIDKMNENILATTELYFNNPMAKVLEKLGFRQYGNPWKSKWHDGMIGLFLKFKKGEVQ